MAKHPAQFHIQIDVDTTALDAALTDLRAAEASYLELLSGARDCPSVWPDDPPGPDYAGTRCQLLRGHDEPTPEGPATPHRHRMLGSQVVVEWTT